MAKVVSYICASFTGKLLEPEKLFPEFFPEIPIPTEDDGLMDKQETLRVIRESVGLSTSEGKLEILKEIRGAVGLN